MSQDAVPMQMDHLKRVAFLGPPSSFTHQAANEVFDGKHYILLSQLQIPDVFDVVQASEADLGVVPFENSSNGSVLYTLDCLIDRDDEFPEVTVCGETYMHVRHCLLGYAAPKSSSKNLDALSPVSSGHATPTRSEPEPKKPRSQPLVDVQHVTDIYSHPQAFGQSQRFLATYVQGAKHLETSSTSRAAEIAAETCLPSTAAIASKLAGEINGLLLLADDIQDQEDNITRFLVLRRTNVSERQSSKDGIQVKDFKALVMFTVDHKSPGALANALQVFARESLNLTNFNSRPSRLRPWHYVFLVECQRTSNQSSVELQIERALKGLESITEARKCLGYWEEKTVPER